MPRKTPSYVGPLERLPEALATLLDNRGLTQGEVARRMKTTASTVSAWINRAAGMTCHSLSMFLHVQELQLMDLAEALGEELRPPKGEKEAVDATQRTVVESLSFHVRELQTRTQTLQEQNNRIPHLESEIQSLKKQVAMLRGRLRHAQGDQEPPAEPTGDSNSNSP